MGTTPPPLNVVVSAQMSRMPTKSTLPEVAVRRALHASGIRYRLHRTDLPGKPDIVLVGPRVAVFVDGCFWHACPQHCVFPKNNADWWRTKLDGNVARDRRNDERLRQAGWEPLHIWEHESTQAAISRLLELRDQRLVDRASLCSPKQITKGRPKRAEPKDIEVTVRTSRR